MARIGPHVNRSYTSAKDATIVDQMRIAFAEAKDEGFVPGAASLFIMGPRDRKLHIATKEAADELKDYVQQTKIAFVPHSAYVNGNPWRGDPTAAAAIRRELKACDECGATGLVVHLPIG